VGQSRRSDRAPMTFSESVGMSQRCQQQTKKAATFDAVWRFGGHHTHPYVSGSDVKNVL
jgi:hypothetical protein